MQIIVNHLTRMQSGYICVAGINIANNQHIRPIANRRLTTDLLAQNGGPFDIAALLDLGYVRYCGSVPEVEDHSFNLRELRSRGTISPQQFWELLQKVAQKSLTDIFGSAMYPYKNTCVVDVKMGSASLGCLLPTTPPKLFVNNYGKIRASVTDGTFEVTVSVTDIRLCEADYKTPKLDMIRQINDCLQANTPVILSVGLSRPWGQIDDTVERHWLQVNNIHLHP